MVTISCIIPTLGRGRILVDTIEMLREQSHPAHEIIVVDQTPADALDGDTKATLASLAAEEAIIWLHQEEPNASMARNAGVLAATGDVVLLLDDDIRIEREFLEAYAKTLEDPAIAGVAGQVLEGESDTVDELPPQASDPDIGWLYFRRHYTKETDTSFLMSGNVALRRDLYLEVGGMDENYHRGAFREESDFGRRFAKAGHRLRYQPRASIYHLGNMGAPQGGSRSWIRNVRIAGFHHCVGDWYFTLGFATPKTLPHLLRYSLRHFVFNRYNVTHPWLVPILGLRWLAALPVAAWRRVRGPKLIPAASR